MKKNTGLGKLTWKNVFHGLITAVLGAVITGLTNGLSTGVVDIKTIGVVAAGSGLGYIGKKLAENSEGELLKKEPTE